MNNRPELGAKVGPTADPGAKTGRAAAVARHDHQPPQQQPGRRQGKIEGIAPSPGFAEGAGQKSPIVQQDHQRSRDHDLLAGHPQQASQHSGGVPEPSSAGGRAADEAVQREQVEQAHQRFRPLHDVSHRLRLQGMNRPEQRDGKCRESRSGGADIVCLGILVMRQTGMSAPPGSRNVRRRMPNSNKAART